MKDKLSTQDEERYVTLEKKIRSFGELTSTFDERYVSQFDSDPAHNIGGLRACTMLGYYTNTLSDISHIAMSIRDISGNLFNSTDNALFQNMQKYTETLIAKYSQDIAEINGRKEHYEHIESQAFKNPAGTEKEELDTLFRKNIYDHTSMETTLQQIKKQYNSGIIPTSVLALWKTVCGRFKKADAEISYSLESEPNS